MRKRGCTLCLALGLGAAGSKVLNGVSAVGGAERALLPSARSNVRGSGCHSECFCTVCMCTHRVSMLTQEALNFDANLPFLQEACGPDSYDDVEAPCLWKREEAWDPHPAAEDQVPRDFVGQLQQRWHRERSVRTTKQKINTCSRKVEQ